MVKTLARAATLRSLRRDIKEGIRSLDAGSGKELDIESIIRHARLMLLFRNGA